MDIFTFILARNSAGGGGSEKKGSARTPYTYIPVTPQFTADGNLITATVEESASVTPSVVPGYVSNGTAGTVEVSGSSVVNASTLDKNLEPWNIKVGVTIFGKTGIYTGGDGGVINGSVVVSKTNGYGIVIENVLAISNGIVVNGKYEKTTDGKGYYPIPTTSSGEPYYLVIKPASSYTKINAVSGNTGGTPTIINGGQGNRVAYVPVYDGDDVYVTVTDD